MVDDPKDYRWCSYAEAVASKNRSREGLQRVMFETERTVTDNERAAEILTSWRKAAYCYRQVLFIAEHRDDANVDARKAPQLSEGEALRCRIRHLADGMALGSAAFIESIFSWCRERFGAKRKSGARKLRGIETPLRTLRDLGKVSSGPPQGIVSHADDPGDIVPVHGNPFWDPGAPSH